MKIFSKMALIAAMAAVTLPSAHLFGQQDSTCVDSTLINPKAICPLVYIPVCGCNGVTYDNSCYAINYGGVTSWTEGPCSMGMDSCLVIPNGVNFGPCDLVLGWAMLETGCAELSGCGTTGSDGYDYSMYFFGSELDCNDQCDTTQFGCIDPNQINPDVICPAVYDPVCGCDGVTYGNDCEAYNWGGVTSWTAGECGAEPIGCVDLVGVDFGDCDMVLGIGLVNGVCSSISGCGWIVDGINYQPYFFASEEACLKSCSGFVPECFNEAQLDTTYSCIEIFNPVCGCDSVTYSNSCFAFYAGVSSWSPGECTTNHISESGDALFTAYPNPFTDEIVIRFPSPEVGTLKIMDVHGKLIQQISLNGSSNTRIDAREFARGMYFIQFASANHHGVMRLTK